jgi:hypothetical protein
MKIISKNEEKYTITIEVDKEYVDDLMDVVRIINVELCNQYNLHYKKNLFIDFDELIVNELNFNFTHLREEKINEIIIDKRFWLDDVILCGR